MDSYIFSGTLPISCWDPSLPAFGMPSCPVWLCLLITLPTILLGQPLPEMYSHRYVPERLTLQPSAKPQLIPGPLQASSLLSSSWKLSVKAMCWGRRWGAVHMWRTPRPGIAETKQLWFPPVSLAFWLLISGTLRCFKLDHLPCEQWRHPQDYVERSRALLVKP